MNAPFVVHPDDRAVVDFIAPNMATGPWIAGGACVNWVLGLPVRMSDLDVFPATKAQFSMLEARFGSLKLVCTTGNANTYEHGAYRIQLVMPQSHVTVRDVIQDFDFRVCQVATDGREWIFGEGALEDIQNRVLAGNTSYIRGMPSVPYSINVYDYDADSVIASVKRTHTIRKKDDVAQPNPPFVHVFEMSDPYSPSLYLSNPYQGVPRRRAQMLALGRHRQKRIMRYWTRGFAPTQELFDLLYDGTVLNEPSGWVNPDY